MQHSLKTLEIAQTNLKDSWRIDVFRISHILHQLPILIRPTGHRPRQVLGGCSDLMGFAVWTTTGTDSIGTVSEQGLCLRWKTPPSVTMYISVMRARVCLSYRSRRVANRHTPRRSLISIKISLMRPHSRYTGSTIPPQINGSPTGLKRLCSTASMLNTHSRKPANPASCDTTHCEHHITFTLRVNSHAIHSHATHTRHSQQTIVSHSLHALTRSVQADHEIELTREGHVIQ